MNDSRPMGWRPIGRSLAAIVLGVWAAMPDAEASGQRAGGQESPGEPAARRTLDDDLLQDLPIAPKKPASVGPAVKPGQAPPSGQDGKKMSDAERRTAPPDLSKPDRSKPDPLGDGEDIERGHPADPLGVIGRRMRQVESRIERRDTSSATLALQRQIVDDLDALIRQLQRQPKKKGSSSGKPGGGQQQSDTTGADGRQPMPQPAAESTKRVESGEVRRDEARDLQRMIKEVWGHLPPRIREQMQNVSQEQFLPQYEKLIEAYYRRLAEPEGDSP